MYKELYIIRHGETDLNKMGIVQGRGINSSLNETGLLQAQSFYNTYKHITFDHVYVSSLKRTKETVQGFIDDQIPYTSLADLDELAWGIWEGKPVTEESQIAFKYIAEQWQNGNYEAKFDGGESPIDVLTRLKNAMLHILSKPSEQMVLVCMHGRALRLLLCHLMNQELSEMLNYPHRNTVLYRLSYDGEKFQMIDFNSVKHLDTI